MNEIARNLKFIRQRAGLTQSQLAKKIFMSQSAYQRIESGKSNSIGVHLQNLCSVLEVEEGEIISFQSNKKEDQIIKNLYNNIAKMYEELLVEKNSKIKYLESKVMSLSSEQL